MALIREAKVSTQVVKDDPTRVFVVVKRTPGDKRLRRAARPGQMMFWRNRRFMLVTTKRGRLFAGIAQSNIRAGHNGFIQVYGPSNLIEA